MRKLYAAVLAVIVVTIAHAPLGCKAAPVSAECFESEEFCDDLELLYGCVIAEAGNQDDMGKRLVIDTVLNRVDSDRWPDTIHEVIQQKNQFSTWPAAINKALDVIEYDASTYALILEEINTRTNTEVTFFTAGGYNAYCKPLFKYGGHYFGR